MFLDFSVVYWRTKLTAIMDEHFFYLLGKYVEAGDKGITWNTEAQNIMKEYEYQRHREKSGPAGQDVGVFLLRHTTQQYFKDEYHNDVQKNVITPEGIDVYNLEKAIRDDKKKEIGKEKLIKSQLLEVNQSVIDTNKSVIKTNFWTPFIAGLAALFSLIALAKGWKTSPLIEPPLQQTIERQALALDSLKQTLRDIDSSLNKQNAKSPDSGKVK